MADHKRDYASLEEEIASLEGASVIGTVHTKDKDYPFYRVRRGRGKRKVLLSGCVHGNEQSGAYAILAFFRGPVEAYLDEFEFTAYTCVNSFGFEHYILEGGDGPDNYTRYDSDGLNINREFYAESQCQEARLILDSLDERYLFTMDFHESEPDEEENLNGVEGEPQGLVPGEFYLYEVCEDISKRIGHRIVENVKKAGIEVCTWPNIMGDVNSGGAIYYPEGCGAACYASGTTFDGYLAGNHTDHAFAIEVMRGWPLEKRVRADLISLTTALDEELKR